MKSSEILRVTNIMAQDLNVSLSSCHFQFFNFKQVSFLYKQLIQIVKQSWPNRVSKPIVQVQQQPPASPSAIPSPFKSLESLVPLHAPLQAHPMKWVQALIICRYNKQLQTAI